MKIAYFINQYPGISHSFIRREIQALERRGVEVARYAIRPAKENIISEEDKAESRQTRWIVSAGALQTGLDILREMLANPIGAARVFFTAFKMSLRSEAGIFRHFFYAAEALVLARWMKRDGIGHVHAHFGTNTATIAMLTSLLGKTTYSFTVHGPEEFEKPLLISLKEKAENSSFVIAISKFGASQLKKITAPEHWDKINIVRCGIEKEFYSTSETPPPSNSDFVCVGRLCAEKGQLDLVEAVALAKKNHPDITVTLIGDGPMREAVEHKIDELELGNAIRLAGWKTPDEVRDAIVNSRAFILPSYAEGLPVSIMEALALQRPVISTYVAGIPELVRPGECGWLTAAGDVEAIAHALTQAMGTSQSELTEMGRKGRQAVQAFHDIDQEALKLSSLFQQLLPQQ